MVTTVHHQTLSPALQKVLNAHREEARRLRQQHGDPALWLAEIVRESFDQEAIEEVLSEMLDGRLGWGEDEPHER